MASWAAARRADEGGPGRRARYPEGGRMNWDELGWTCLASGVTVVVLVALFGIIATLQGGG